MTCMATRNKKKRKPDCSLQKDTSTKTWRHVFLFDETKVKLFGYKEHHCRPENTKMKLVCFCEMAKNLIFVG